MTPSTLDYIRAHQFLYYVLAKEVLTDREYDMFGRWSGLDYKGGSDQIGHYTAEQKQLAIDIYAGRAPAYPPDYAP